MRPSRVVRVCTHILLSDMCYESQGQTQFIAMQLNITIGDPGVLLAANPKQQSLMSSIDATFIEIIQDRFCEHSRSAGRLLTSHDASFANKMSTRSNQIKTTMGGNAIDIGVCTACLIYTYFIPLVYKYIHILHTHICIYIYIYTLVT